LSRFNIGRPKEAFSNDSGSSPILDSYRNRGIPNSAPLMCRHFSTNTVNLQFRPSLHRRFGEGIQPFSVGNCGTTASRSARTKSANYARRTKETRNDGRHAIFPMLRQLSVVSGTYTYHRDHSPVHITGSSTVSALPDCRDEVLDELGNEVIKALAPAESSSTWPGSPELLAAPTTPPLTRFDSTSVHTRPEPTHRPTLVLTSGAERY
jgi:hypothetical protein